MTVLMLIWVDSEFGKNYRNVPSSQVSSAVGIALFEGNFLVPDVDRTA